VELLGTLFKNEIWKVTNMHVYQWYAYEKNVDFFVYGILYQNVVETCPGVRSLLLHE
jgi:hypothetical protein